MTSKMPEAMAAPPFLPLPDDIGNPDDGLCNICQSLDLAVNRFVVLPGDEEYNQWNKPDDASIYLGKVEDVKKKTHCPFCRLVLVSLSSTLEVPNQENGQPLYISLSWTTNGPRPNPSAPWNHRPEVRLLRLYLRTKAGGFPEVRLNFFPEITLLANDSPTDSTAYFIRQYEPDKIDFAVVRRWLALCDAHHGEACRKNPVFKELKTSYQDRKVPDFRCVDVEKRCVTKLPSGSRYAALSYVWGVPVSFKAVKGNIEKLEEPGSLDSDEYRDKVPLTIRDALHVAKEIGIRYLWVDNLCIVQDDPDIQKETIKTMDLIYSEADLVIITAGSNTAMSGISGLRSGTRGSRQPIEQIAPGFRLAFNSRWMNLMGNRPYNTRGWTYQETHFATRSLIFIGGKAVFRCQGVDAWEEHLIEDRRDITEGQQGRRRGFEGGDIGEFEGLIQNYSERKLSFESDVYNAFAGVSRQLMVELDTDLCHGMPTRYFDWFLLWRPLSLQSRRLSQGKDIVAPSWSWSGWVGTSWPHMWDWYNRSIGRLSKAIRKRTWIIWYQRDNQDSATCTRLVRHQHGSIAHQKESTNFYGSDIRKPFNLDSSQTKPSEIVLKDLKPPTYVDDILSNHKGSGFLQFWTVSLILQLNEPVSRDEERGPTDKRQRLGIYGRSERELGIIRVQPSWLQSNPIPQEREFILICEGRDKRAENGRDDDEKGWRYMAMLLEWVGEKGVRSVMGSIESADKKHAYAERVAIGSIGKHDLIEALGDGPVWKEIILG